MHFPLDFLRLFERNCLHLYMIESISDSDMMVAIGSTVRFSHSVMSDYLQTSGMQQAQASLSITKVQSLCKFMSIELVTPSNHLILCHPLLLLPSIFPSIRVFSNESALCIRWPKYWSFNFSISPSNEHSRLISFRMGWLGLLAGQRTFKRLVQQHSSKASIDLSTVADGVYIVTVGNKSYKVTKRN